MSLASWFSTDRENSASEVIWEDDERVCRRVRRTSPDGAEHEFVALLPTTEIPRPEILNRFLHEYELKDYLDSTWALRPRELIRERGLTFLIIEHPDGVPLQRLIGSPMEVGRFLRIAVALSAAIGRLHGRGLIHKDIKPSHVIVNSSTGEVWLTGFGITSRLRREHQSPEPPEFIAGTLAYMAPEQTGRMNRSIDSRSDLYSLGITLYQTLTGELPFNSSDPMEWVHCHIARKPDPPSARVTNIPEPVSAIVMKLLSKTPEERYQTAAGLEADLRRCLIQWKSHGRVDLFPTGAHDLSDKLQIPEKLYGRKGEVDALLTTFDRVVAGGRPELVLISGYSGIGKSAVVYELHRSLVPPRGLFASGKFDQYKRDIPYSTVALAFQSLVRPLLSKPEFELSRWRDSLRQALSPNGSLVLDLVPELKLVIGEQPPVPALSSRDAKTRSHLAFRRFISVFARPEHPLALFFDDLQWLDAATLDFLEDLLIHQDLAHLLIVGAYRSNEVDSGHPLIRKLSKIRDAGGIVHDICLTPLGSDDLTHLVADSLHCEPHHATLLAELIFEKTGGNPFFAIQFLHTLVNEGLITFEHGNARWSWDSKEIRAKGYTDNIVDLMVDKLRRLPLATQRALQQLACIGNSADIATLSAVLEVSRQDTEAELWEGLHQELIVSADESYRFVHDRVQEAAYSLIAEDVRAEAHLRIGRLLYVHTPSEKREEAIFEIVNQFSRGAQLITSEEESYQVAELNLVAGKRAKASAAYASALKYFIAGKALLTDESWEHHHKLMFRLELHRAECEFLIGELAVAAERVKALRLRAADTIELANATCLGVDVYMTLGKLDLAVAISLDYLRHLGIEWPPHPTEEQARSEYARIWSQLGSREIEEVIDFPLMSDPASIATLDVLIKVLLAAFYTDANLAALVICRAISVSIEGGNSDASCTSYVWLGVIAGPTFGDYKAGFRFGQLGYELVEKRGLKRFQAWTYVSFAGLVMSWMRHVSACCDLARHTFEIAYKLGDLTFAAFSYVVLSTSLIAAGDPLTDVHLEVGNCLDFAQKAQFGVPIGIITAQLGLIRTLRGLTTRFGSFDDAKFTELDFELHLDSQPGLAQAKCWYWIRKLQANFYAGDYQSAIEASLKARTLLRTTPTFGLAEYEFYSALARAACADFTKGTASQEHFDALKSHYQQLQVWAGNCPDNFENRAALVGAEIARVEGRAIEAERLYEQAIRSSQRYGFIHNEALAYEIAAQFYAARNLQTVADAYLRCARDCFDRWGASGKVRHLEARYPQLRVPSAYSSLTATIDSPVGRFDVETVVKASQAVSREISLPNLVEKLIQLATEHAGADRALLVLAGHDGLRIEAEARAGRENLEILMRRELVTTIDLPQSVLQYVLRTHEQVLIDDASILQPEFNDEYLRNNNSRSILCLPILRQTTLIGVLYLENSLTDHAFTANRIALLNVLASQAAISLENALLYASLSRSEELLAEAQRLSLTGSFLWRAATGEVLWSQQTHRIFDIERNTPITLDLVGSRIHPEDLSLWHRMLDLGRGSGSDLDYEFRIQMLDGTVKHLHVVAHASRSQSDQLEYIGAVQDVTQSRVYEAALGKVRSELAHVSRVSTLGNLSASIAHARHPTNYCEFMNANTCLRRFATEPPNVAGTLETLRRVIRDANRASDVINRLRALFGKEESATESMDLNEAAKELIALSLGDFHTNKIILQSEYADDLPLVSGDRVQLQQVILNLLRNATDAMTNVNDRPRNLLIKTERDEEDRVRLTVKDSGIGFSQDGMDQLFNAFYTTKRQGMGMGLSVSRSIIESHNGRLWAAPNDGPGVAFSFSIPITQQH